MSFEVKPERVREVAVAELSDDALDTVAGGTGVMPKTAALKDAPASCAPRPMGRNK